MKKVEVKDVFYKGVMYRMIPTAISSRESISYTCIIFHPDIGSDPIYSLLISPTHYTKATVFENNSASKDLWHPVNRWTWESHIDHQAELFIDRLVIGMTSEIGELGSGVCRLEGKIIEGHEGKEFVPKKYQIKRLISENEQKPPCELW